jgi:hypothetical protein
MTQSPAHKRLEDLISRIEAATSFVRDGKRIDIKSLDAESLALSKMLKSKPDATIQPLLSKAVLAIERLTFALEDQVQSLKDKTKK